MGDLIGRKTTMDSSNFDPPAASHLLVQAVILWQLLSYYVVLQTGTGKPAGKPVFNNKKM